MALRSRGLTWKGNDVSRRVREAASDALAETANAALAISIPRAPFVTGFLRGSGFVAGVRWDGERGSVRWGFSARYAAYVALGTRYMRARDFLTPAIAAEYPRLAGRIQHRLARP